jgi:hypothetical protein
MNDDNQSMQFPGSVKLRLNIPICSQRHLQFTVTGDLKKRTFLLFSFPVFNTTFFVLNNIQAYISQDFKFTLIYRFFSSAMWPYIDWSIGIKFSEDNSTPL